MLLTSKKQIHIRKEALKFSAAHMTVFADGSKERLHGHNYTVDVALELNESPEMLPFSEIKKAMREICDAWDERVFLALRCPQMKIQHRDAVEIDFTLCGVRYVLPLQDLCLLEVTNITSESLCESFALLLRKALKKVPQAVACLRSLEVRIDESPGQGASVSLNF